MNGAPGFASQQVSKSASQRRFALVSSPLAPAFKILIMGAEKSLRELDGVVYVVDDDKGVRDGMSDLLQSHGFRCEHFESCERFLEEWRDDCASCLLLDVQMPGVSGLELQERLRASGAQIPIIFMTAHGDVPMVRRVMKAGAIEFLTKPVDLDDLIEAIEAALHLDKIRRQRGAAQQELKAKLDSLSAQQRRVMEHVTAGLLNKQIAAEMNLSEITVKQYRRQVMEKMQAQSVAELARMVAEYSGSQWG